MGLSFFKPLCKITDWSRKVKLDSTHSYKLKVSELSTLDI